MASPRDLLAEMILAGLASAVDVRRFRITDAGRVALER
jgi:hypothetical protein